MCVPKRSPGAWVYKKNPWMLEVSHMADFLEKMKNGLVKGASTVADGSGKLVRQEVQLGQLYYGSYEILSGLTLEDKVAFPYGKAVKEGAKTEDISYMEFLEDAYA